MELHIDGWKQHLCFSAAHFIPQHEHCGILHGHTYVVSCTIEGTLDSKTNMILDFSKIKTILRKLAEKLDHHILIADQHSNITRETKVIKIKNNNKTYTLPTEDCIFLPIPSTTAEHLASYVLKQLVPQLIDTKNIHRIAIRIDEGLGQGATVEQIL